jgi:hypothetical protein
MHERAIGRDGDSYEGGKRSIDGEDCGQLALDETDRDRGHGFVRLGCDELGQPDLEACAEIRFAKNLLPIERDRDGVPDEALLKIYAKSSHSITVPSVAARSGRVAQLRKAGGLPGPV